MTDGRTVPGGARWTSRLRRPHLRDDAGGRASRDAPVDVPPGRPRLDGLRLAVTLLTTLRVAGPRVVDRTTATGALRWFVVVGALLAAPPVALLAFAEARLDDDVLDGPAALLAAVLVLGYLALATRGLHLDGLADTADALGVHGGHDDERARARALAAAGDPAVGALGVVALVLVLAVQAGALAVLVQDGSAAWALLTAVVVGRVAVVGACAPRWPAARPDGLGALVAGTARRHVWAATTAATLAVLLLATALAPDPQVGLDLLLALAALR